MDFSKQNLPGLFRNFNEDDSVGALRSSHQDNLYPGLNHPVFLQAAASSSFLRSLTTVK